MDGYCEECGSEYGVYRNDPFEEEMNQKEIEVCLCDDCYSNRCMDI